MWENINLGEPEIPLHEVIYSFLQFENNEVCMLSAKAGKRTIYFMVPDCGQPIVAIWLCKLKEK